MAEPYSLTYLKPEVATLKERLDAFLTDHVIPAEAEFATHMANINTRSNSSSCSHDDDANNRWSPQAVFPGLKRLQREAQRLGLWNLFLPPRLWDQVPTDVPREYLPTTPLTYREYGILAESMGRSLELGAMACNCSAPDTGNMEVLLEFGTAQQKRDYLVPLLKGEIRSTFLMTEPQVASSDPTNLETTLEKRGPDQYVLNGQKWWSTGAMDPRCRVAICVARMVSTSSSSSSSNIQDKANGETNQNHGKHTIVLIPLPHPQVRMVRPLTVFGYDDAPFGHAEVALDGIRLSRKEHLIGGEGSGFRVSQARLGPGRIHHCMRAIGCAQRCYDLMLQRTLERKTFGKYLWQHGSVQRDIAESFSDLQAARLLTLQCAHLMDIQGPRASRQFISSIKVAVPRLLSQVIDRALQVHGGAGVSEDFILARAWASMRTLRIADGPDEVHRQSVALLELKRLYREQFGQDPPPRSKL